MGLEVDRPEALAGAQADSGSPRVLNLQECGQKGTSAIAWQI